MTIERLTSSQTELYKSFFQQGLEEHEKNWGITVYDDQNEGFPTEDKPDSFTLLATNDTGNWLGVVSFKTEIPNRQKFAHRGLIFRMYVASHAAGNGVGHALMSEVIKRARVLGQYTQINLTAAGTNHRAKALYNRLGFVKYATEPKAIRHLDGSFDDLDFMVLYL